MTNYTYRGTHEGELWGIEPTQRAVEIQEASVMQFEEGKYSSETIIWDRLELYRQLGNDPPAA